jgi:hypothetical protein
MDRTNRWAACAIVVFSLAVFACGSSPSAPSSTAGAGPFVVAGQVLDVQTNAAVPGATVIFADPGNTTTIASLGQSIADGGGSYQLSLMPRQYSVYVDKVYAGLAQVRSGVNRTDLLVHPTGCIVRYGTIGDSSTGRPIAGAAVSLLGVAGTSGSDGTYRLDFGCVAGLWSNSICILVTRAGYQDACVPMGRGENFVGVIRQDVDLTP